MKRIATRRSALALWQAARAAEHLEKLGYAHELVTTETTGDRMQQNRLADERLATSAALPHHLTTGKGLFIKEVQDLLLEPRAEVRCHVAVHSMKDLPVAPTEGLTLAGFLPAASPRDVVILHPALAAHPSLATWHEAARGSGLGKAGFLATRPMMATLWHVLSEGQGVVAEGVPAAAALGSRAIGTTSLRRAAALRHLGDIKRPIEVLRGNVDTRLRRLKDGDFAAILLAEAGLSRLGLFDDAIMFPCPEQLFVPACVQGVVGLETRADDTGLARDLYLASEPLTVVRAALERLILKLLGGDCHSVAGMHLSLVQRASEGWDSAPPAGHLLIFTATPSGSDSHVSVLATDQPLHAKTTRTLGSWIEQSLRTWSSCRHFGAFFETCLADTGLVADLSVHLAQQNHARHMNVPGSPTHKGP